MKYLKLMALCIALISANANANTVEDKAKMERDMQKLLKLAKADVNNPNTSPERKALAEEFLASDRKYEQQKLAVEESNKEVQIFADVKRALDSGKSLKTNIDRLMIDLAKNKISGVITDKDAVRWLNEHGAEGQKLFDAELANKDSALTKLFAREGAAMRMSASNPL